MTTPASHRVLRAPAALHPRFASPTRRYRNVRFTDCRVLFTVHGLAAPLLLAFIGCGGDGGGDPTPPEPPATPTTVTITPATATLNAVGDRQQYRAQVLDQRGRAMSGVTIAWSSTQPGVAEVDRTTGLATATGPGMAGIRAVAQRISSEASLEVVQIPVALEKTQGDGGQGYFGRALAVSPVVRVLDANGHSASGIDVTFEVTSGGGSVSPDATRTGADGTAQTEWTLGGDSVQTLGAAVSGLTAEFTVTATEPPLEILTDSLAWGRATLDYRAELSARGGSGMGYVWSIAESSALPAGLEMTGDGRILGAPEEAGLSEVEVRVTDSNGRDTTTTFGMRVCDAPLGLAVGDVMTVDPEALEPCGFLVVADEVEAYYRVTFAGLNAEREASWQASLSMEPLPGRAVAFRPVVAGRAPREPAGADEDRTAASGAWTDALEIQLANEELHREIRRQEAELMREMLARGPLEILPNRPQAQASGAAVTPVTFKLYNRASGGNRCAVHQTLLADVIAENDDFIVYEDVEASSPVSVENANRIIDFYSEHGKEIIEGYFGGVSDVNGDGRIALLVDPALPGVQAFVWSADMTFSASTCPASNEMELVHMSEDAFEYNDGYWALAVLVHEVKHVSSLYKRVVNHRRRGSRMGDETFHPLWIEEGAAEIAKEMSSRLAWERAGGPAAGERADLEDMRIARREAEPEFYGVFDLMSRTVRAFSPELNAIAFDPNDLGGTYVYGSGWHFHRFLRDWLARGEAGVDMSADAALVTALNDTLTVPGVEGIEEVTGMTMAELLHAHAIAMTVAGSEDLVADDDTPRFLTYDFPTATEIITNPDPPGRYPWPRTMTGEDDLSAVPAAVLGLDQRFTGRVTSNGVRFLDFEAMAAGASAVFRVTVGPEVSVIVARIAKPL